MKPKVKPEEQALFRQAMKDVKPLALGQVKIQAEPPKSKPKRKREKLQVDLQDPYSDYETLDLVDSDERIEYLRPGVSMTLLQRLRRGKESPDAILDLHGQTVEEARVTLYQFIMRCQAESKKTVLVIHGKGRGHAKPILKNKLNHWLRQSEAVLAFCSAKIQDGGAGALYLRLGALSP